MILSFHPVYTADRNLLCAGREPGATEREAIQAADAVILPQGCRESLYSMARSACSHVFPNYDARFQHAGKSGQIRLFRSMRVPHPHTHIYSPRDQGDPIFRSLRRHPPFAFPFVFKFDWGGEGETVFLIDSPQRLADTLQRAALYAKSGQYGFLLQKLVPAKARSLRVVAMDQRFIAYWRIQEDRHQFYTNLKKGATINRHCDPLLLQAGIEAARQFCGSTQINLAGLDFLFDETAVAQVRIEPLFLEINYFFGRRGLGGSEAFYRKLNQAIDDWLTRLKLK